LVTLCSNPNCNLLANHKGEHSFIYKKAWESSFNSDDINKIQKAGYCTPRGGAKGGYQNHVNRNSKVIIPYEKLPEVNLDNYQDGYVIRVFPSQYFSSKHVISDDFINNRSVIVGENAFVLYRTYEDFENLPPLPDWQIRSILKFDKKTKTYSIPSNDRRGDIIDCGHYLLRISNSGTNKKQNRFEGPAQGIFAPEYADANTNFLCQAVLAWLIIKTDNSPYKEADYEHLKAIIVLDGKLLSEYIFSYGFLISSNVGKILANSSSRSCETLFPLHSFTIFSHTWFLSFSDIYLINTNGKT